MFERVAPASFAGSEMRLIQPDSRGVLLSVIYADPCSFIYVFIALKVCNDAIMSFQEMLEALTALSVFFSENSLRTRRNLRGDIERRSLAINEDFARIFKEVKEVMS